MSAAEDAEAVFDRRRDVFELASALSLAAHIDVRRARAVRIALLPGADVSTEADLWTSVLVDYRGAGELVLRPDVRAELWQWLLHHERVEPAWRAIESSRPKGRPLLELEEKITYHALLEDLGAIEEALSPVVVAMRDEPTRRRDLSAWASQALLNLPPFVRECETARILGSVAQAWVATPSQFASMEPSANSMQLVRSLQPSNDARQSVYVRRIGNVLEASFERVHADDVEIPDVPTAAPVLYIDHDTPWRLVPTGTSRFAVIGSRIMIGTSDLRRWWLEARPDQPNLDAIVTIVATPDGSPHAGYVVAANRVATCASAMTERQFAYIALGDLTHSLTLLAVDQDSDIAVLELTNATSVPPVELTDDVQQGQTWQAYQNGVRIVGTIETAWPKVSIRLPPNATLLPGSPVFIGAKVLGHVGSEPIANGIMHVTSARLVRWWLDNVGSPEAPPRREEQTRPPLREPAVWVQKLSLSSVPRELKLQSSASAQKDDHVVVFVTERARSRPGAIYRARGGRRFTDPNSRATSTELDCELVLEIPRPPDDVLKQLEPVIAALDNVTSQENTKRLGIHERLFGLLVQLLDDAGRNALAQIFGMEATATTPKVYIEVPERVSTAGLLGVQLDTDGAVRRFRRHQWLAHEVAVLTEPKRPDEYNAIRIQITSVEIDPTSALMEFGVRQFRNPNKEAFWGATARAASSMSAELIRGPRRGGTPGEYDLQLVVNRAPFVPTAHAYRRGVQFIDAALDAMSTSSDEREVVYARYAGVGALDLVKAQALIRISSDVTLVWIDPEADIVALMSYEDAITAVKQVGSALGLDQLEILPQSEPNDPLFGRFGIARQRRGRRIDVTFGGWPALAMVQGDRERPIRGYVTFYVTKNERSIERIRVQARDGVASCQIAASERRRVIGAVIEDEGLVLESLVEIPPMEARKP